MTFPTIQTADTKNGTVTSNSTSWTITYPTNVTAGDLLLFFAGCDGSGAIGSAISGFSTLLTQSDGAGAVSIAVFAKLAAGTETGTFTFAAAASEQGGWRIFRITGWFGGAIADGVQEQDAVGASGAGGTSSTPNPPSEPASNWGVEDTLWFAACAADTSRTVSVYPLAGNNTADVSGGAGGATLGLCTTISAVDTLDPGTFTISASDDWAATTVAVRPAAVVVSTPYDHLMHQIYPAILAQ